MPPPSLLPHPQQSLPPLPAPPPQYPAYLFPLSPTFTTWSRLTIHQIHHSLSTRPGGFSDPPQNIYFWGNKPIKWVRIVGVVVSWDVYEKRYVMVVDDGSGETIEIVCGRKVLGEDRDGEGNDEESPGEGKHHSYQIPSISTVTAPKEIGFTLTNRTLSLIPFSLGSIIKAKGSITTFRGVRQLSLERIFMVKDTAEEARCWAENTAFTREVLEKEWVVGKEEERRWKRRAEGRGDREKRKREKKEERRKRDREGARETRIEEVRQMRRSRYEGSEYEGEEKMIEDQDEEIQARRRKVREERHREKDKQRKRDIEKASILG